jgi:putative transposase
MHIYLSAIIDWATRMIVGWELSEPLEAAPVVKCFERAIEEHGVPAVTSSDQGSTYTADIYVNCLAGHGIRQSMDGKARWVDNVVMERWC